MLHLWYSPIYTHGLSPEASFPRERYELVRSRLERQRLAGLINFEEPHLSPSVDDLALAHDREYVERFLTGRLDENARRRIGLQPWTDSIVQRTLLLTGATISATVRAIETGGLTGNMAGGTHHAYTGFGSGYCIFNDLAIAARIAQRDLGVQRILILDLDVHQGDGTASIFEDDPSVRTVSFHCGKNFPTRKMRSDHDQEFAKHAKDREYLSVLRRFLDEERQRFPAELIFYQAGVDGLYTDRLGHLSLTRSGLRKRNDMVFRFAQQHQVPLVITMGGGYGAPIETSVDAHVDLFRQAADHMQLSAPPGVSLKIPDSA